MGAIESEHASHDHHKKISGKIKSTYKEGGVIILSDEELKHMWSHYDENHNDLLDLDELEKMVADLLTHTIEDETLRNKVKDELNKNSKDGDFVKDIFNKMKNKDGVVKFEDFDKSYHHILKHFMERHNNNGCFGCCTIL